MLYYVTAIIKKKGAIDLFFSMNSYRSIFGFTLFLVGCLFASASALSCTDLLGVEVNVPPRDKKLIDSVVITGAIFVAASGSVPGYCQVDGQIDSDPAEAGILNFQVRMPDNWNGRFLHVGNGGNGGFPGFYGSYNQPFDFIDATALEPTILGYANAVNDAGTSGGADPLIPEITEQKSFLAFLSTHLTTVVVKDIIEQYYQQDINKSYFSGCSLGGLQALMEVTQFPSDFDGIIAQDVVPGTIGNFYQASELLKANNLPGPSEYVDRSMMEAAYALAVQKCGDANGLIQDGYRCDWDPEVDLAIPLGLDANQLNFFKTLYSDIRTSDGQLVQRGFPPGCERDLALWFANDAFTMQIFGTGTLAEGQIQFARDWMFGDQTIIFDDLDLDDFDDANSDYDIYNVGKKFRRFIARGNKLMVVSNGGSGIYAYYNMIENWSNRIVKNPNSKLARNYRHYIVPNSGHCGVANKALGIVTNSGVTATIDLLGPMVDWVENDVAPEILEAKVGTDQADFGICPYPKRSENGVCVDQPLVKLGH